MEDEYNRDYSFEPEFVWRKDSIEMHRSRLERTRKHNKVFKRKEESIDLEKTSSEERLASNESVNIVDAEVNAFRMVKKLSNFPKKL